MLQVFLQPGIHPTEKDRTRQLVKENEFLLIELFLPLESILELMIGFYEGTKKKSHAPSSPVKQPKYCLDNPVDNFSILKIESRTKLIFALFTEAVIIIGEVLLESFAFFCLQFQF